MTSHRMDVRTTLRLVWRRLRGGELTPARFGLSLAVGLFIGSQPLYGLHFPLCTLVCVPFRLDLLVAYLAANVSNPLLAPLLFYAEVDLGSLILTGAHAPLDVARVREVGVGGFAAQAAVGSITLGTLLGACGGGIGYGLVRALRPRPQPAPSSDSTSPDTSAPSVHPSQ